MKCTGFESKLVNDHSCHESRWFRNISIPVPRKKKETMTSKPAVVKVTAAQLGPAGYVSCSSDRRVHGHAWHHLDSRQILTRRPSFPIPPRSDDDIDDYSSYEFDLGNLCGFDGAPVGATKRVDYTALATRVFQSMTKALFKLPFQIDALGRIAELPAPTTALPREKPLPKPRPPTKWEIFAQRKGIQKRKRSTLEFDETNQEWRRRYGYKRVDDENDVPIIDAGRGEETGVEDPFSRKLKEKKERVKKNEKQRLGNLKNAVKEGGKGALPATLKLAASLPEHGRGKPSKRKEMLGELKKTSKNVAVSTASMGRHDKVVKGENMKHRTELRRKAMKSNLSSTVSRQVERTAQGKLVDSIISRNADDILDIGKAIRGFESQAKDSVGGHRLKRKGANKKGALEKAGGKSTLPSSGRKKAAMKEQKMVDKHNAKRRR
jgi:regulator of ribosome biosynthesis